MFTICWLLFWSSKYVNSLCPQNSPAAAKSLQLCLTLCDPIDGSPPGSPIPGILQARTLEWVAISFSNGWKWKVKVKSLSRVWLFTTPWTAAYHAPLSMWFSRQEYWSGVPLPSPVEGVRRMQTQCDILTGHYGTLALWDGEMGHDRPLGLPVLTPWDSCEQRVTSSLTW